MTKRRISAETKRFLKILAVDTVVCLACLGNQIADIAYLCNAWDYFYTPQMKIACLSFMILNLIASLGTGFYLTKRVYLKYLKDNKDFKETNWKQVLFCIFMYPLVTLLTWTKLGIIYYDFKWKSSSKDYAKGGDLKELIKEETEEIRTTYYMMVLCLVFFETLPELVIQSLNNSREYGWTIDARIAISFQVLSILVNFFLLTFIENSKSKGKYDI